MKWYMLVRFLVIIGTGSSATSTPAVIFNGPYETKNECEQKLQEATRDVIGLKATFKGCLLARDQNEAINMIANQP